MSSFWRIFSLELLAFLRTKALAMLLTASVLWMLAAPHLLVSDGTDAGARQMCLKYSLGGVAALLSVVLLASATGAIAREREAKRLQLTMVRPVRFFTIALGKIAALSAVGAFVLAVAAGIEAARQNLSRPCRHVLSPVLPSPREEAEKMYEMYMKDPETPEEVKKTKKSIVIRLLTQRAVDHYQVIPTNAAVAWKMEAIPTKDANGLAVRLRFSTAFDIRDDVRGTLSFGGVAGSVSNITQAVTEVPLAATLVTTNAADELVFRNEGASAVMLRPRRDVNLLVPADGFGWNLARASVELLGMLVLLISLGVFLGAGLGQAPALFTAIVILLLSEVSPSVVEQYPDQLETNAVDHIGLAITRLAAEATHPLSALTPLSHLAADERIETREVVRTGCANLLVCPLLFALLSAVVLPRKENGTN